MNSLESPPAGSFWRMAGDESRKDFESLRPTDWWIVTGGPSTGKTTLLDFLAQQGFKTMPEAARVYIDQEIDKGRTIEQIRSSERNFQEEVLGMKYRAEDQAPESELILWDRGADGDSIAYIKTKKIMMTERSYQNYDHHLGEGGIMVVFKRRYKGVFLLDRLSSYETDYARVENEGRAAEIQEDLREAYGMIGYQPIKVPVFSSNPLVSVEARAQFIVDHMRSVDPNVPQLRLNPNRPQQPGLPIKF